MAFMDPKTNQKGRRLIALAVLAVVIFIGYMFYRNMG
jgi:hypothetical protein